jgi:hypothetical protein
MHCLAFGVRWAGDQKKEEEKKVGKKEDIPSLAKARRNRVLSFFFRSPLGLALLSSSWSHHAVSLTELAKTGLLSSGLRQMPLELSSGLLPSRHPKSTWCDVRLDARLEVLARQPSAVLLRP